LQNTWPTIATERTEETLKK